MNHEETDQTKTDFEPEIQTFEEASFQEESSDPHNLINEQLQRYASEICELKSKYHLALADAENMRTRLKRESQEMISFAVRNVLIEILGPLDNFESALGFTEHMSDEVRNWAIGFQMILSQLQEVLTNHGVSSFHSTGKKFDIQLHEAVEIMETDEIEAGTIVKELSKGYKHSGKLLRPAKVVVAQKPNDIKEN